MYALFILDSHAWIFIISKPVAVKTVGIFVAPTRPKSNADFHLVLDARLANCDFLQPWVAVSRALWLGQA